MATLASTSTVSAHGTSVITRRLHLSGLAFTLPSSSLLQRFTQSDGTLTAHSLHRPTEPNAVGVVPTHAWLTVTGEARQLERAITALNGTTWKGAKVRVTSARHDGATGPKPLHCETPKEKEKQKERELAKAEKEKRRKKVKLSDRLHRPIDKEDVEQGEWGWYATPTGHLVRPLHMRPLHPLARPTNPAPPMRAGSQGTRTPPSRARRTTLDPKRYGAQHLKEDFLQSAMPAHLEERQWLAYEEGEDGVGLWRDTQGRVERVQKVERNLFTWPVAVEKISAEAETSIFSNQEQEEESESDDDSVASSVSSGLFGVPAANLEEPTSPLFPARTTKESSISPLFDQQPSASADVAVAMVTSLPPPAWNPQDDDAFSEGYAEDAGVEPTHTVDAATEAKRMRDILASLLGPLPESGAVAGTDQTKKRKAEALTQQASTFPTQEQDASSEFSSQSEAEAPESDAVAPPSPAPVHRNKRDALLQRTAIPTAAPKGGFAPVVRFDPGPAGIVIEEEAQPEPAENIEMTTAAIDATALGAVESQRGAQVAQSTESGQAVKMQSLTEMFKPQEASTGFSLMANLEDLDLDLDLDLEPTEAMPSHLTLHDDAPFEPSVEAQSVPGQVAGFDASQELAFFFPKVEPCSTGFTLGTAPTSAQGTARDVRVRLMRAVQPFCRTETSEQIKERWTARRGDLTQEWKRRHREALKKKKRGVTGSRRAGDMLPGR